MALGSWQDPAKIPTRFSPGTRIDFGLQDTSEHPGGKNLAETAARILLGSCQEAKFPTAIIRQDSRWDPGENLAAILGEKQNSWQPKSHQDTRRESRRDS